jgi:hypothetical protein
MRRSIVVAAALVSLLPASAGAESLAGKPALRLVSTSPLKIRGLRFVPKERVRVMVLEAGSATKRVRADKRGTFVASFNETSVDRCSALSVLAVGSRGSRAEWKRPGPLCPPRL